MIFFFFSCLSKGRTAKKKHCRTSNGSADVTNIEIQVTPFSHPSRKLSELRASVSGFKKRGIYEKVRKKIIGAEEKTELTVMLCFCVTRGSNL